MYLLLQLSSLVVLSVRSRRIICIHPRWKGANYFPRIVIVVQLFGCIICLRGLWRTRQKSNSKYRIILIIHTIAIEVVNVLVLATIIAAFSIYVLSVGEIRRQTCFFVGVQSTQTRSGTTGNHSQELLQLLDKVEPVLEQYRILEIIAVVAFGLSGLLTDAILVSRLFT